MQRYYYMAQNNSDINEGAMDYMYLLKIGKYNSVGGGVDATPPNTAYRCVHPSDLCTLSLLWSIQVLLGLFILQLFTD